MHWRIKPDRMEKLTSELPKMQHYLDLTPLFVGIWNLVTGWRKK